MADIAEIDELREPEWQGLHTLLFGCLADERATLEEQVAGLQAQVGALTAEVVGLRDCLPPLLVSVTDAARRLGVSERTVRRGIKKGDIPTRSIGRRVLVDLGALRPLDGDEVARMARKARDGRG